MFLCQSCLGNSVPNSLAGNCREGTGCPRAWSAPPRGQVNGHSERGSRYTGPTGRNALLPNGTLAFVKDACWAEVFRSTIHGTGTHGWGLSGS